MTIQYPDVIKPRGRPEANFIVIARNFDYFVNELNRSVSRIRALEKLYNRRETQSQVIESVDETQEEAFQRALMYGF